MRAIILLDRALQQMERRLFLAAIRENRSLGLHSSANRELFLKTGCLKLQDCQGQAVIVGRLRVADLGLRLPDLRLTQLDDGTQPHGVARLGKIERQVCRSNSC